MLCRKPVSALPTSLLSIWPATNVNQIPFQNMFSLIVNVHLKLCDNFNCTNHNDDDNAVKGTTPAFYVGVKTLPETSFLSTLVLSLQQRLTTRTQYFVNFSFSALIINSLNAHFGLFSNRSKLARIQCIQSAVDFPPTGCWASLAAGFLRNWVI